MQKTIAGGASSAASWAVHSGCERYRGTDPMVTGKSRRLLAKELGAPDATAGIPDARWTRAMIFERLCHDGAFAGEVTARATGWSGFERPADVYRHDCNVSVVDTREALHTAAERARVGSATLLYKLAFPYPGFTEGDATTVLPDLAVVARGPNGPTLIVGDVKDYERVRSRIDDGRLLKGFLQVAMGAFAFSQWPTRPGGLEVSSHGFLAVPRSVFLQPTVEVEDLTDHLQEVETQWQNRLDALDLPETVNGTAEQLVAPLDPGFDPNTCPSCSLFRYCRSELRGKQDPDALLREIGVPVAERAGVEAILSGGNPGPAADPTLVRRVTATVSGHVGRTGQLRLDPVGRPGTVNVVAVKSDAAALGFHGLAVSRVTNQSTTEWTYKTFPDPQADLTRRSVMAQIGNAIELAMRELREADTDSPLPVHIVVPDGVTADLLASTADLLAGVELSRLRWQRDKEMGRPILTYNGEEATMPKTLDGSRRVAVSFLLEQDRARMLSLREPLVDLTSLMSRYFVPGGASSQARRLDYAVSWAAAHETVDHRSVTDSIEESLLTPGARLSNESSNRIHAAMMAARTGARGDNYDELVMAELQYRTATFDAAVRALQTVPDSKLQPAYRTFEGDAQRVWRRRMRLRASDLVRFGRTYPYWRNQLVDVIQADATCQAQVAMLVNPLSAAAVATDAGSRDACWAQVTALQPLTLSVESRQFGAGDRVIMLSKADAAWVESAPVVVTPQKGSVRLRNFPIAALEETVPEPTAEQFVWQPAIDPGVEVGDRLVIARLAGFGELKTSKEFNLPRPSQDENAAPKKSCEPGSFSADSEAHKWCCKPHEAVERDFSDEIAIRRARRELNPEVWPPVRDDDGFEVPAAHKPTSRSVEPFTTTAPEGVTTDELE
ncbi:hypothetical protein EDD41_2319 [Luteococcus japonicus]|uniref:PD-(D/E)XK nuclease superfamily protein n=1 Tax=Luteococcus japonicus TaxID=33984 RepID=A0A3N1ZWG6_9ACTN|nr:hypothetical protein [Luteococcus japonicus]ROR55068.1 hypothetical protein EDD41_2319 [Luteococcus japonicus]